MDWTGCLLEAGGVVRYQGWWMREFDQTLRKAVRY